MPLYSVLIPLEGHWLQQHPKLVLLLVIFSKPQTGARGSESVFRPGFHTERKWPGRVVAGSSTPVLST